MQTTSTRRCRGVLEDAKNADMNSDRAVTSLIGFSNDYCRIWLLKTVRLSLDQTTPDSLDRASGDFSWLKDEVRDIY